MYYPNKFVALLRDEDEDVADFATAVLLGDVRVLLHLTDDMIKRAETKKLHALISFYFKLDLC